MNEQNMNPDEDIIDVLYNKPFNEDQPSLNRSSGSSIRRRPGGVYQYGFEYQHPPTRNYYEDLFQIQRRNFHGSDSVYGANNLEKRPLSRTESSMYQVGKYI